MTRIRVSRQQFALIAIVLLVAVAGCSGASNQAAESGGGDGAQASGGDAGFRAGGNGGGGVGSYYDADGDRVVVRESNMELRVDNFSRAFRSTRQIAARYDGYVGDRSQNSQGDWDEGRLTVRVPPENFSSARDELAALGHVEDESVTVRDFTSEYDDRAARIQNLQQEEQTLERLLNRTNDTQDAEQIRRDLQDVRNELRSLRNDQQSLERRESLSTIRLSLHEPVGERPPENYRSSFGFDDAFMEAFYGGLTAVKYVVVFFGYAIPIGLSFLPLAAFGLGLAAGYRRLRGFTSRVLSPGVAEADTARDDSEGTDEQSEE